MIEIRQLCKIFHSGLPTETKALNNVDLTINAGEMVVLKGPSGSGKSTLLSMVAALSKPTSGEVIVRGQHISKLPDHFAALYRRKQIGFIFQQVHLIPSLTVLENILIPLMPSSKTSSTLLQKAGTVMEQFSIGHKQVLAVRHLSGGEMQRVAMARAMINQPAILLADEPTANLDADLSGAFIETLKKIHQAGTTILVATHDPIFFALPFSARQVEMHNGWLT